MAPAASGHRRPRRPRPRADYVQRPVPRRSSPGGGPVHVAGRRGGDAVFLASMTCRSPYAAAATASPALVEPGCRARRHADGPVSSDGDLVTVGAGARLGAVYDASSWTAVPFPLGPAPASGSPGWRWAGVSACSVAATDSRPTGWSRPRSCWPTAASSRATSATRRTCSGRSRGRRRQLRGGDVVRVPHRSRAARRQLPPRLGLRHGRRRRGGLAELGAVGARRARRQPEADRHRRPGPATQRQRLRCPPGRRLRRIRRHRGPERPGRSRTRLALGRDPAVRPDPAALGTAASSGDDVPRPRRPRRTHPWLVARSEFFRRPLPTATVAALLEVLTRDRAAGEERELDFMPWGGAYNRVPPTPPPSSIATRCFSSSTRPSSTRMRPLEPRTPPSRSCGGRGKPCIRGDRAESFPPSPTGTSPSPPRRTTAATCHASVRSRPATTPPTSSNPRADKPSRRSDHGDGRRCPDVRGKRRGTASRTQSVEREDSLKGSLVQPECF